MASDQIQDSNLDAAYSEVLRLAREVASPYLDGFQVKLIPSTDPLAEAAMEIHRQFPGRVATRFGRANLGGMGVERVYIYPASLTATAP